MNSTLGDLLQWDTIQWKTTMEQVRNLKYRIFMAKLKGNRRTLRRLQKLMLYSRHNIILSVRKITAIYDGKKTHKINKVLIKDKRYKMVLVEKLCKIPILHYKPRIMKKKPILNKNLTLGMERMLDLCIQTIVLNALEPEWEACFEANSYGFRPGRSEHDAIGRVFNVLSIKGNESHTLKWVLNTNIEGFDNHLCHQYIFKKLDNFPAKQLIMDWLKFGYMEEDFFNKNEKIIPRGAIISPLLVNIALDELAHILNVASNSREQMTYTSICVSYTNDLVVLCSSKLEAQQIKKQILNWLKKKGLQFTIGKIDISPIEKGFEFLGVDIRYVKTNTLQKSKGKKLLISPSKKTLNKIIKKLKNEWKYLRGKSIQTALNRLNPIITDWANYHRKFSSSHIFKKLDNWTFKKSWRYVSRMHANKSKHWIYDMYYGNFNLNRQDRWVFGNKETGQYLKKFSWFKIKRHVIVNGSNSPFDPRLQNYWEQRYKNLYKNNGTKSEQIIASNQNYQCPICEHSLYGTEPLYKYHLISQRQIKIEDYWNIIYMHSQCHQILQSNPKMERQLQWKFLFEKNRINKHLTKNNLLYIQKLKLELLEYKA